MERRTITDVTNGENIYWFITQTDRQHIFLSRHIRNNN